MGPFGVGELVIIFLVILLIFGPKKLPQLARGLGKGINEFKDAVETGKKEILDTKNSIESDDESGKVDL
jgi:sec-independent protein translocase protein TatA